MQVSATETARRDEAMAEGLARLAAEVTAGESRLIHAIGAFDASEAWGRQGALTCAQWLGWRIGMSAPAARERIRVARALRDLPEIDAAFSDARLSYSKVRALTRVATPDTERVLLEIAQEATAAELERVCRSYRRVTTADAPQPMPEDRYFRTRTKENGRVVVTMEVSADEAARLIAAVDSAREAVRSDDVSAETPPDRVDGVMALAESFFETGARPRRGGAPHEVVLHLDASDLQAGAGETAGFLPALGDLGVSAETSRRLCCDASVVPLITDDAGHVLDVGRKRRTVPPSLRRALNNRDCL